MWGVMIWFGVFFFLTWFCFWFDGPMVVLGYIGGGNVFTVLLWLFGRCLAVREK